MSVLKEWFDEVGRNNVKIHHSKESEFVIYKGFKLSKSIDGFTIQDVRRSDFYDDVKIKEHNILCKLGFIRGADLIVHRRNVKRVSVYTRLLEKTYSDRKLFSSKLRPLKTREFYKKKIRNCQDNIKKYIDLLFLYKSRVEQYNLKYNINEKIN